MNKNLPIKNETSQLDGSENFNTNKNWLAMIRGVKSKHDSVSFTDFSLCQVVGNTEISDILSKLYDIEKQSYTYHGAGYSEFYENTIVPLVKHFIDVLRNDIDGIEIDGAIALAYEWSGYISCKVIDEVFRV